MATRWGPAAGPRAPGRAGPGLAGACLLLLALAPTAGAEPILARRAHSVAFTAARFDQQPTYPQLEYRYQRWGAAGAGLDAGLSTLVLLNQLDVGLLYRLDLAGGTSLTARAGPTAVGSLFSGAIGMAYGLRFATHDPRGRGLVIDGCYRTFPTDAEDSALPILSGGVGLVWYGGPGATGSARR